MSRAVNGALRRGLWGLALGTLAVLGACGGDDHGDNSGSTPPTGQTTSYGFEPYLQQVVQESSCDSSSPVTTTNVSFVFAADQDMAEPRDLSKVTPGCKQ